MYTRLDARMLVRRELQDTAANPFWSDQQIHDDLQAGFAAYTASFPNQILASATATNGQTSIALPTNTVAVLALVIDGVTVPQAPDAATLYEPAFRNQISQTTVQPVTPYGSAATHGQAWALVGGQVALRYGLSAGRAIALYCAVAHVLPGDDVTPLTIPDADIDLPVLYACDRLVRSAHTDAVKRGAPGAWADAHDDTGYAARYAMALRQRRRVVNRLMMSSQ